MFGKILTSGWVALALSACAKRRSRRSKMYSRHPEPALRYEAEPMAPLLLLAETSAPSPSRHAREDISWTDPDNPDAGIPELETLMAAPKKAVGG